MISQEALYAAKKYLSVPPDKMGGALQSALGAMPPNMPNSLGQLIAAHKIMQSEKKKKEEAEATALAQRGSGIAPGQQNPSKPQTVAEELKGQLQGVLAQYQQEKQTNRQDQGIASLDIPDEMFNEGSIGGEATGAGGGIVAFNGEDESEVKGMSADSAQYHMALRESGVDALGRPLRYIAPIAKDILGLPGQLAFQDGTTDPKYKKEGWFPRTSGQRGADAADVARFSQVIANDGKVRTAADTPATTSFNPMSPWARGATPSAALPEDSTHGVELKYSLGDDTGTGRYASAPSTDNIPPPPSGPNTRVATATTTKPATGSLLAPGLLADMEWIRGEQKKALGETRPAARTLEQIYAEREAAQKAAGVDTNMFKEESARLASQAKEAIKDRDVGLWMSVAKAGFAMAGGTSQYAMVNMAKGLGLGTEDAQRVLKEYRIADNDRKKSIFELKKADRLERIGKVDAAMVARDKAEELDSKHKDRRVMALNVASNHVTGLVQSANLREASLAQTEVMGAATAAHRQTATETREDANRIREEDNKVKRLQAQAQIYRNQRADLTKNNVTYSYLTNKSYPAYAASAVGKAFIKQLDDLTTKANAAEAASVSALGIKPPAGGSDPLALRY